MTKAVNAKNWSSFIKSWTDGTERSYPQGSKVNYVGVNLQGLAYYSPEQPFLNLFKQAAANSIGVLSNIWYVDGTSVDPYLVTDSDYNVTTMVNSKGTTHTKVSVWMNENINGGTLPPNASALYPTGNYRLQFSGPGTFYVGRDATIPTQTPPAGVTISTNTVTSTLAMGVSASITVTVTSATNLGIEVGITSLPNDGVNYLKFISLVQSSLTSQYDGGQIFHPNFLAALAPYSRIRFMDWGRTNNQEYAANFTADLPSSGTSGQLAQCKFQGYISGTTLTITSWYFGQYAEAVGMTIQGPGVTAGTTLSSGSGNSWQVNNSQTVGSSGSPVTMYINYTWGQPDGTYTFLFPTGQAIPVTCTYGSSNVSWTTPLSGAVSSTTVYGAMAYWSVSSSWSGRSLMSNFSWAGPLGVPHEVRIALCNQLGVDCWNNIPMGVNYIDSTYATKLAQLMHDGTGASIATPLTSFTGLSTSQKAYIELSNEVWNTSFTQSGCAQMIGKPLFPTASNQYYSGQEWYGTQVAGVGDAFYAVYGATDFARVIVSMGGQTAPGGGPAYLNIAMNTPNWTSAAYTHHIGAIHFAPYIQILSGMSTAGIDAINALADPVSAVFGLVNTSVYLGVDYSTYGLSTSGWGPGSSTGPNKIATILADTNISGQPWHTLPVLGYEGGEGTDLGTSYTTAQQTLFKNVYRDARMKYVYYDPGHVLSSNGGYFAELIAAGMQSVNVFNDCSAPSQTSNWAQYGDWGQIENPMQLPTNGNAPGKWQGCYNYATGA